MRFLGILCLCLAAPLVPAGGGPVLLVLGDSLSAGYGIERADGWVNLLRERLAASAPGWTVVNAAVSGDTTAGGLARLPRLLERHAPAIVIVELGANDGLRALPPAETRRNLEAIIQASQAAGAAVVLVPVRLPPNYGEAFVNRYLAAWEGLPTGPRVVVSDYLMRGIAEDLGQMQADGLHPLAVAQPRMLENLWPVLEPLLRSVQD